jgi:hypothetical protein
MAGHPITKEDVNCSDFRFVLLGNSFLIGKCFHFITLTIVSCVRLISLGLEILACFDDIWLEACASIIYHVSTSFRLTLGVITLEWNAKDV